jgi:tetratricopeptide (TPR) repeat protein
MRLTLQSLCGKAALSLLIAGAGAALLSGTGRVSIAAQNPVDLDKALQGKVAQDRAQSYYHYALSRWYIEDGDLPRALTEIQEAVRYNVNSAALHVSLADILSQMGRTEEALAEAQNAARLDPKDPGPLWMLASIHLRSAQSRRTRQTALESVKLAVAELEKMKQVAPDDARAFFALGGCYMELGQPEKAIVAYERWQDLVPEGDQGYAAIAQYYERQGNEDKAIEYLQKAIERRPDSIQSLAALAELYGKAHRDEEAIPIYKKILELTGGSPEIKSQLAAALLDAGQYDEAVQLLSEMTKANPQDPNLQLLLGRAQAGSRRFPEAIQTLKSVVSADPRNMEAKFYLGVAYEQGGQPGEAVTIFLDLLEQTKGSSSEMAANRGVFQQHLASSYQASGEDQKAIEVYQEMVESDPGPYNQFLLIDAYRLNHQFEQALSLGKQEYEKNPKDENLALVYGRTLADSGKTKEGAEVLNRLLQENPENLDVYINLSQIYIQAKRYGDAEKILLRAGEMEPDEDRVKYQLVSVYEKQKNFDRAESLLKDMLKKDPKDAVVLNYIGYMLADRGVRLDEAVAYVQQALEMEPQNGAYLDSLGWAYYKLNDLAKAEKYLLLAVEYEKRDPVIQDHLGDLYYKTGNLDKAKEYWTQSLDSGGEPEDASKVREKLDRIQDTLRKKKR